MWVSRRSAYRFWAAGFGFGSPRKLNPSRRFRIGSLAAEYFFSKKTVKFQTLEPKMEEL